MAVSQLPQAPYRQDRKIFPTPIIGDVLFSEVRDCNRGNPFPEYGTPHPNPAKWPDHKLVYVKPVDVERNEIFEFFYAAERENQDFYNFAFGNRVIGNREFRMVTRTYITLREDFKPVDIEFGTPMPNVPEDKFGGVSYVFYDKEQQNSPQEELNSLFVIETHSYVEAAVLDEQLSLSVEKPDPLPPKFRVLSPTTISEELAEGEVTTPTLTGDQLAATEDQINTNLKRKRTVSRSSAEEIGALIGKQLTNDLQVAQIEEFIVADGTTIEATALTVDASVEPLGNGQSVKRVITAPELFTAKSYSSQRPDTTPEIFRVLVPTESTEENIDGTALMPDLDAGEIESSEQQINKFVKRKRSTRRDTTILPQSLEQKNTTNQKQIATVTQTLQIGDTLEEATATKDIQSEALGDGTYLVREIEVPELFTAETFSIQKPDTTPEKFRALLPSKSTEQDIVGTASMPTLATGELEASEQQVNKFVKRKRSTKRDAASLPQSLTQKLTTNDKQVATVIEVLKVGDTLETASATKDIQSEALGDGTYLVRTVEVPELFASETFATQRPDTIPERFRAEIPTQTAQSNKVGQASQPILLTNELERSNQQLNEFVYREQITKRNISSNVSLPEVQRSYVEGTVAKVNEKISTSPTIESGLLVSESQATPIGDGKFVVQTVKVDNWPELKSSDWDPVLDAQIVRTEQFVEPPTSFTENNTSFRAINKDRALKVVEEAPVTALSNYAMSFPIQVDLRLPDVLKSISVVWAEESAQGRTNSEWDGYAEGLSWSLSGAENTSSESSASIKPELVMDIQRPWGSDLSATAYYFYIKGDNNVITESNILSKLSSIVGDTVQRWPSFAPVSHTLVLSGGTASVQAKVSWNAARSWSETSNSRDKTVGQGDSYSVGTSLNAVTIPPTIHGAITISGAEKKEKKVDAFVFTTTGSTFNFPYVVATQSASHTLKADVNPKTLAATTPSAIPTTGQYLVQCQVVPYKWGWSRCSAVVFDAANLS